MNHRPEVEIADVAAEPKGNRAVLTNGIYTVSVWVPAFAGTTGLREQ